MQVLSTKKFTSNARVKCFVISSLQKNGNTPNIKTEVRMRTYARTQVVGTSARLASITWFGQKQVPELLIRHIWCLWGGGLSLPALLALLELLAQLGFIYGTINATKK